MAAMKASDDNEPIPTRRHFIGIDEKLFFYVMALTIDKLG